MGSVHGVLCYAADKVPQVDKAAAEEEAGAQVAIAGDIPSGGDLPMGSWSEPPRVVLECILDKERTKACDFFCAFEQKLYGGAPLPDSNKWIFGSSKGWLVTADIWGSEIYLFNPVSRDQIYLPSKTEIPRPKCDKNQFGLHTFEYLSKAALSKSPGSNTEHCAVMAIISSLCVLSFCRLGYSKWTNVADSPQNVSDIIYYKEQFYAVNRYGVVVACDTGPSPKATAVVRGPDQHVDELVDISFMQRYLVESQGELLQVVRRVVSYKEPGEVEEDDTFFGHRTVGFKVYKLQEKGSEDDNEDEEDEDDNEDEEDEDNEYADDEDNNEDEEDEENEEEGKVYESIDMKFVPVDNSSYKWVKLNDLGDQIIFLGFNQSLSLPAGALANSTGNCIYFTDDYIEYYYGRHFGDLRESGDDMGVFSLEDGSVHPFHPKGLVFPMPPIWVSPAP